MSKAELRSIDTRIIGFPRSDEWYTSSSVRSKAVQWNEVVYSIV